ncbi:MAG: MBL fold metallo-hydrolase, partial [Bradymonadaceae bacterium]
MRVSFYGTRGTVPVSGGDYKQTGGGTSCVVVRGAGRDVVLDAGSGLLDYGRELMERFTSEGDKPVTDMLFSHAHLDHLVGLPSFGPLFMPGAKVRMWGPRTPQHDSFQETVESLVHPPYFPIPMYEMSADIEIFDLMGRETLYLADQSDEALHV